MKRLICIVICIMLALSMAACGGQTNEPVDNGKGGGSVETETGSEATPKPQEPLELKIVLNALNWTKNNLDINDSEEKKAWEQLSNTKITYNTPPHSEYYDKVNIMFSSGDIPDLIYYMNDSKAQLIDSGYIIPLDEFIVNHGQPLVEKYSENDFNLFKTEGKLYAVPSVLALYNNLGFLMRKDWLDNLGLKMPETLEEYHNVLRAFTNDDPDGDGENNTFGGTFRSSFSWMDGFCGAFDVNSHGNIEYDVIDGKLVPQQIQPKFKEYLAYMRQLWSEGLFTPNSMINTGDQWKMEIFTGIAGMWWHQNTRIDEYFSLNIRQAMGEDYKFELCAPLPPVGKDGARGSRGMPSSSMGAFITDNHKDPERIFQYVLWTHTSPDAVDFAKYGLENKHHSLVDGKKQWKDEALKNDTLLQIKEMVFGDAKYYIDDDEIDIVYGPKAAAIHEQNMKYNRPYINLFAGKPVLETEKEYPDIGKVLSEYVMKIVTGELPLEAFDEMVQRLNDAGLDKVTAARQEWYDANKK